MHYHQPFNTEFNIFKKAVLFLNLIASLKVNYSDKKPFYHYQGNKTQITEEHLEKTLLKLFFLIKKYALLKDNSAFFEVFSETVDWKLLNGLSVLISKMAKPGLREKLLETIERLLEKGPQPIIAHFAEFDIIYDTIRGFRKNTKLYF